MPGADEEPEHEPAMSLIEWKPEFETGVESVDFEHREMIDLINRLHDRLGAPESKDAVADFLGEIYARISAHFALEESLMRERDYDGFAEHKADHERLLDEIRNIMDAHEDDRYADVEATLGAELERWFAEHFRTQDARLAAALG